MRGKWASLTLILGAAATLFVVAAEPSRSDGSFEVAGHVSPLAEGRSAGGAFVLAGEVAPSGEEFKGGREQEPTWLLSGGGELSPTGTLCFCANPIFGDSFESGGTAAWSDAFP